MNQAMKFELFEGAPLIDRRDSAPTVREAHGNLFLSYRSARDPRSYSVLCFENCKAHFLGWPPASQIEAHPCFCEGLQPFQVHVFTLNDRPWRWIVTMRDCTLDLEAERLVVLAEELNALNSEAALEQELQMRFN